MKLRISCMQCFREDGKPSNEFMPVEMRDDGLYKIICPRNHTTITVIQELKFEVLFDIGAMALLDGYPREAISSISASLERFYEFYIQVISLKFGISFEEFESAWKVISVQSERQFGVFLFLYLLDHKVELEPVISNVKPDIPGKSKNNTLAWAEFRNAIIHKGYIPSTAEVLAYGDIIYKFIYKLIKDLRLNSSEYINKSVVYHLTRAHSIADSKSVTTMGIPTLISLTRGDAPPGTFRDALEELKKYKGYIYISLNRRNSGFR